MKKIRKKVKKSATKVAGLELDADGCARVLKGLRLVGKDDWYYSLSAAVSELWGFSSRHSYDRKKLSAGEMAEVREAMETGSGMVNVHVVEEAEILAKAGLLFSEHIYADNRWVGSVWKHGEHFIPVSVNPYTNSYNSKDVDAAIAHLHLVA